MELHSIEGTQRLEDPVSRMTLKFCGGVPRETSAKYCALRKSLSGTPCPFLASAYHAVAVSSPVRSSEGRMPKSPSCWLACFEEKKDCFAAAYFCLRISDWRWSPLRASGAAFSILDSLALCVCIRS